MNGKILRVSVATAVMVMSTGCATIMNEKTQRVNIVTSSGEKVDVQIDGMPFEAPGIATVTRAKGDKIITTKNPKCNSSTLMPSSVDTVFWVNILSGGVFGSTTDYSSEKMWKYQDTVTVTCKS